jgi:hypothetical protein
MLAQMTDAQADLNREKKLREKADSLCSDLEHQVEVLKVGRSHSAQNDEAAQEVIRYSTKYNSALLSVLLMMQSFLITTLH